MVWFFKNNGCSIGVDVGIESLKMAQLKNDGKIVKLVAGARKVRPDEIEYGSIEWQKWAIDVIQELVTKNKFKGKDVSATIPASEVFIDHIKMPTVDADLNQALEQAILAKIKSKLDFPPADAMIKHIPTEEDNCLVIATQREKVDRMLAIYEQADLRIKSIAVWPVALANTYVTFFGRRRFDLKTVVILLDIEENRSNIVICRHKNPLFCHSIPIGAQQLQAGEAVTKLTSEMTTCRKHFGSMYKRAHIERMIFLSGKIVDEDICKKIAKKMKLPAQIGDCLAAVEIGECQNEYSIGRRGNDFSVATAFGLSLS